MDLHFSVPSFWSQLTNAVCLIWPMSYVCPSERTPLPFFFWIHFPSLSFSSLCSLGLSPSVFLISSFMSLHIICFLLCSPSRSPLSFLVLCLPFPKPSTHPHPSLPGLHFLFHESSCSLSPPPTCPVQSLSLVLLCLVSPPSHASAILHPFPFFFTSHLPPNFFIPSCAAQTLPLLDKES